MSILRASKCVLPLIKRATQRRIVLQTQLPSLHHFRFLSSTVNTTINNKEEEVTTEEATTFSFPPPVVQIDYNDNDPEETIQLKYSNEAELELAWQDYLERSKHELMDCDELHDLGREIKYGGGEKAISRIQIILKNIIHQRNNPGYQKLFDELCGMLIHLFGTVQDTDSARIVFDGLVRSSKRVRETTILTMMDVLRIRGTRREFHEFCKMLEEKKLLPETTNSYTRMLYGYTAFGDMAACRYCFTEMEKKGLATDEHAYRTMIYAYRGVNNVKGVMEIYDKMKRNDIKISNATYTLVLSALQMEDENTRIKGKKEKDIDRVSNDLKNSGESMNAAAFLVLNIDPKSALTKMKEMNWDITIRDYNVFLAYYIKKNQYENALDIFNKLKQDDTVIMDRYTYSIALDLLVKSSNQSMEAAFALYEEMKEKEITPDRYTFSSLLFGCHKAGDLNRAMEYFKEMESFGIKPNVFSFNNVLNVISSVDTSNSNRWNLINFIWKEMRARHIQPDVRSYNLYLTALAKMTQPIRNNSNIDDSLLLPEGEVEASRPVKAIIKAYRNMKTRDSKLGVQPDFVTYTIVITALCKAGQLRGALKVYDDTKLTNYQLLPTTYNHIMAALEKAGKTSEIMNIWHDMRLHGVPPDNKSYEIVLDACDQLGLSESLSVIREQRKSDLDRLLTLEKERHHRMNKQ